MRQRLLLLSLVLPLLVLRTTEVRSQWARTNGPFGAGIGCLASSGTNIYAGIRYADSAHAGVYRSTDSGATWFQASSGLPTNTFVGALAAVDSFVFAAAWGNGVYYSSNYGLSWIPPVSRFQNQFAKALFIQGPYLFAGSDKGVFRSIDHGHTWQDANAGIIARGVPYANCFAASGPTLFVGTQEGAFRSSDGGFTWDSLNNTFARLNVISSIAAIGSTLNVGTIDGFYRSTDGGNSWKEDNMQLGSGPSPIILGMTVWNSTVYAIIQSNGIYRRDAQSWTPIRDGLTDFDIRALQGYGSYLFAGTQNTGVHRLSVGSQTWGEVNTGLPANASTNAMIVMGKRIVAAHTARTSYSDDGGVTWVETQLGQVGAFAQLGTDLFAASPDLGVCLSNDSGATWFVMSEGLGGASAYDIVIADSTLFVVTTGGVFSSSDSGRSWIPTNWPVGYGASLCSMGSSIFAVSSPYGLHEGLVGDTSLVTIAEPNWIPKTGDVIYPRPTAARGLYFFLGNDYYDSTGMPASQIFRTSDHGKSWEECARNIPFVTAITLIGSKLLIGTKNGIYLTTDEGLHWKAFNDGLTVLSASSFAANSTDVFAGIDGRGVWRRPLAEMIGASAVSPEVHPQVAITSYPNPLSTTTSITVTPEHAGIAQITVHNLFGIEVARLFSGELGAGEHAFTWDARDLPQGMYECVARMGGRVVRVPMMVIR